MKQCFLSIKQFDKLKNYSQIKKYEYRFYNKYMNLDLQ